MSAPVAYVTYMTILRCGIVYATSVTPEMYATHITVVFGVQYFEALQYIFFGNNRTI